MNLKYLPAVRFWLTLLSLAFVFISGIMFKSGIMLLGLHISTPLAFTGALLIWLALWASHSIGRRESGFRHIEDLDVGRTYYVINPADGVVVGNGEKKLFPVILGESKNDGLFLCLSGKGVKCDGAQRMAVVFKTSGKPDDLHIFHPSDESGPLSSS